MSAASSLSGHHDHLRCRLCGDVIGVYEPLILESQTGRLETSVLAEPDLFPTDADCYHRDCYVSGSADDS